MKSGLLSDSHTCGEGVDTSGEGHRGRGGSHTSYTTATCSSIRV